MRRKNGRYKKDNQIKLLEINNDISEMKRGLTTNQLLWKKGSENFKTLQQTLSKIEYTEGKKRKKKQ